MTKTACCDRCGKKIDWPIEECVIVEGALLCLPCHAKYVEVKVHEVQMSKRVLQENV